MPPIDAIQHAVPEFRGTHVEMRLAGSTRGGVMAVLGYAVLIAGLISAVLSAGFYYRSALRGNTSLARPRILLFACTITLVLASLSLLSLILTHDYSCL